MEKKEKYPITVGDLLDFLETVPRDMLVCCRRYSDMGFQEMPKVVDGIAHPTYVEWYRPRPDAVPGDKKRHDKVTDEYLLFEGN